jgi:hypothetical protein
MLASLNPPEEDATQASLSLEDSTEVPETDQAETIDAQAAELAMPEVEISEPATIEVAGQTNIAQEIPDAAEGQHHD